MSHNHRKAILVCGAAILAHTGLVPVGPRVLFAAKKSAGANKADAPAPAAKADAPAPAAGAPTEDDIDIDAIAELYKAGDTGAYINPEALVAAKHFGYVEVNETLSNENGVAARLSPAGRDWADANVDFGGTQEGEEGKAPTSDAKELAKTSFEIDDNVAMPTTRAAGGREGKYPFDKLNVGQSFHIPATDDTPKPNARYGSAVTSANKRFEEAEKPNRFKIRAVGKDDPRGAGARVFRIA